MYVGIQMLVTENYTLTYLIIRHNPLDNCINETLLQKLLSSCLTTTLNRFTARGMILINLPGYRFCCDLDAFLIAN